MTSPDMERRLGGTLEQLFGAIKNGDDARAKDIITKKQALALQSDPKGVTALHYAAGVGRDAVISTLLELKADTNVRDLDGRTPLHYAAQNGHLEAMNKLLELKADTNVQDLVGRTPLHYAVQKGHREAVNKLLDKDADRTIVDKYGQTPSALAMQDALIQVFNSEQQICRPSHPVATTKEKTFNARASPPQDKEKIRLCQFFKGKLWEMGDESLNLKPAAVLDLLYGDTLKIASTQSIDSVDLVMRQDDGQDGSDNENVTNDTTRPSKKKKEQPILCKDCPPCNLTSGVRWVHLPANNREWVTDLVQTICAGKCPTHAMAIKQFVKKTFQRAGRQTAHRRPHFEKSPTSEMFAFVVPVLDIDMTEEDTRAELLPAEKKTDTGNSFTLLQDHIKNLKSLDTTYADDVHMPRSLDRAYYDFLNSKLLAKRDKDQVMLRYLQRTLEDLKREESMPSDKGLGYDSLFEDMAIDKAAKGGIQQSEPHHAMGSSVTRTKSSSPQIIMVRQLWLWKLDNNTIITTFPERWDKDNSDTFYNRLERTMKDNVAAKCLPNGVCSINATWIADKVWNYIIERCIDFVDIEHSVHYGARFRQYSCRDAFASSIARLAELVHIRYQDFQDRVRKGKANQDLFTDLYDEMIYLAEIDDILDELTMIKRALNNQAYVKKKTLEEVEGQQPSEVANYSHPYLEVFERLTDDANRVRKCITTLLDLRQKEATIEEARSSAQQSNVLFIFTAATVIFAPLSFATSLLALEINGFKNPYRPAWVTKVLGLSLLSTAAILIILYAIWWLGKYISLQVTRNMSRRGGGGASGTQEGIGETSSQEISDKRRGGNGGTQMGGGLVQSDWARDVMGRGFASRRRLRKVDGDITDLEVGEKDGM